MKENFHIHVQNFHNYTIYGWVWHASWENFEILQNFSLKSSLAIMWYVYTNDHDQAPFIRHDKSLGKIFTFLGCRSQYMMPLECKYWRPLATSLIKSFRCGGGRQPSCSKMSARDPPVASSVMTQMCLGVSYHSRNFNTLSWSRLCMIQTCQKKMMEHVGYPTP